jgi:hypothetical protein
MIFHCDLYYTYSYGDCDKDNWDRFKNNKRVLTYLLKQNLGYIQYISDELKNDKKFILNIIENSEIKKDHTENCIKFISKKLLDDEDIIFAILRKDASLLSLASDRKLVSYAIGIDGNMLKFASKELQNDKEIVLLAVKQNTLAV